MLNALPPPKKKEKQQQNTKLKDCMFTGSKGALNCLVGIPIGYIIPISS